MKILWIGLETDTGLEKEHQVLIMNKHNWNEKTILEFNPDISIEREFNSPDYQYQFETLFLIKNLPTCKRCIWLIDTHVSYDRHKEYCKMFDFVFLAISSFVEEFKQYNPHTYWLPLCAPFTRVVPKEDKIYPIGYVGRFNVPFLEDRTKTLEFIESKFPKQCHFVTDYATAYKTMSQIKIMVNISYLNDMNFRTFEALACGCTLVTNRVTDLYKIKGLVDKIYIWEHEQDCVEIISNLIDRDPVDNSEWVYKYHMLTNRSHSIINMVLTDLQEEY